MRWTLLSILEQLKKFCGRLPTSRPSDLFEFWLRFGSVAGRCGPSPSPKPRQNSKIFAAIGHRIFLIALAVALAGCAGYQLGPTNGIPAGSRSVRIQPFVNKTHEPRVPEYIAISMRKQLQQDGTYRLETSSSERPDIMVSGEVTRFARRGLSYQTNDVLTPQEYTLTLTARVVAVQTSTGKTNLDREVTGFTYIIVGNDQSSAERQAIPLLADSLARNAVSLLVDGEW
jgi:hypothetical protein